MLLNLTITPSPNLPGHKLASRVVQARGAIVVAPSKKKYF